MSKISCEIVKDLLPLYYDNVCSDDSKRIVTEHISECNSCKSELDRIQTVIKIPKEEMEKNKSEGDAIKKVSAIWKRSRTKELIKGVIITTIMFTMIILGYLGLFRLPIVSVPMDVVDITNVCELEDGRIAYYVKFTDGYDLRYLQYDVDENGNYYVTPYRAIIKVKPEVDGGLSNSMYIFPDVADKNTYQEILAETKALYFGNPEDNILVWEKGMNLPKASEEIEKMFNYKQIK